MTEPNDPFSVPQQPNDSSGNGPSSGASGGSGGSGYGTPAQQPPGGTPGYGTPPTDPPGYGTPPAGYGQQPGYGAGQPAWGETPPGYGPRKFNTLAIIAFVAAFICSPAGIIMGAIARNQIRERGEGGGGLALAAIIIGVISLAIGIMVVASGGASTEALPSRL